MKTKNQAVTILTWFTAAAALCVCVLWLVELARGGFSVLAVGGMLLSLAAAVLPAMLLRRLAADRRARDEALAAMERAHEQALALARAEARQEMETFRNALSHSLRMPVSIIQGYAELLSGPMVTNTEARREYLEKIVQRSEYMSDVMSRFFSGSELVDSGRLSCEEADLLELIRRAAADIQPAAKEQGVTVQVVSPEETLPAVVDTYLVNRAIFNLLENSLKYMGRPGVITIRVLRQEGRVSVLVQDDGLGMPSEETEHVFAPRFQGSNRGAGSGYGLHLVKRTVEAHGGTVSAQSAPGRGMGVTMVLPLRQENA